MVLLSTLVTDLRDGLATGKGNGSVMIETNVKQALKILLPLDALVHGRSPFTAFPVSEEEDSIHTTPELEEQWRHLSSACVEWSIGSRGDTLYPETLVGGMPLAQLGESSIYFLRAQRSGKNRFVTTHPSLSPVLRFGSGLCQQSLWTSGTSSR
jgi:hypothetical protein